MSRSSVRVRDWTCGLAGALCLALFASQAWAQTSPYPPADRPWAAADYAALEQVVLNEKAPLPTLADPGTRPVFERLVAERDVGLDMVANKQGTPTERLQEVLKSMAPFQTLLVSYGSAAQSGKPMERELAKLMVASLAHAAAANELVAEIVPTLPHDSQYEVRMIGLEQMRGGMREILSRMIVAIGAPGAFSKASQLELIAAIKADLPAFRASFTDESRADLAGRLGQAAAQADDPEVKSALEDLLNAVA